MTVPEKEESTSPIWASSTNWLVADGSLEGSISFETSSTECADVTPIGVLLERPADSPPCEITIFFRERHEIHSIYVRSSARVFEVYYASDSQGSGNEYLCTVRCGAAVQEVTQDMCERVLAEDTVSNDINSDFHRCDSDNVMEDGWVEVEVSDSLRPDNSRPMSNISVENIYPKTQIQYEATAEISDASPCMSITLRLLSLQIKTYTHIDEIYIYADPVGDADADAPVSNAGAGSLMSMILPSLLQLSKSGTSRLQDQGFSDVLAGPKYFFSTEGAIHAACPDKFEMSEMEASSMMEKSNIEFDQQQNEEKLEHPLLTSSKIVTDPDQPSKIKTDENNGVRGCVENLLNEPAVRHTQTKPGDGNLRLREEEKDSDQSQMAVNNETNAPYVRIEKILDDLVSRMGKLENFCLSFQDSILKPLTGIEKRLQRMEEQLDAFSKVPLSAEAYPSTIVSRLSSHESSFENEDCKSSFAVVDSSSDEKEASVDLLMLFKPESEKISGLVVKAPEFPDDDDDDDEPNIGYSVDLTPNEYPKNGKCVSIDNALASAGYSVDLTPNEYPKNGKCVSIDSALASALAAFVISTTEKSSLPNTNPMAVVPNEQQNCGDDFLDPAAVAIHSEANRNSVSEWFLGDKTGDVLCEARDEICQGKNSYSDVVPDSTLNKFDMIDKTGAKVQGSCLCDEFLPGDDESSAEIEIHESKGLIIRAPEFPNEDDILDCGENADPHVGNYPNAHSHALPHSRSTPLALFLSSRKVSPSRSSSITYDELLELSASDRNSFSLSTFQDQGGSDGMRKSSFENYVNIAAESSLVGCFLSQGSSPPQVDIFHGTAAIGEEIFSFINHTMEDANHVLSCDGLHSKGMSKGCTITQNLLPCNGLNTDRSSICVQDKECWVIDSKFRTAERPMPDLLGEFKEADSGTPSCFVDIVMSNSGSSEAAVQCPSPDGASQMKSLFEPKKMSSFIPCKDDLTSNVKFCADTNLRSWLPLEILLGEKQDEPKKDDQLKLAQENLVSNLEFSLDKNLGSRIPLEVLLDENPYNQVENMDYGNADYGKQHNSSSAQGLEQNCEIADNTLFYIEGSAFQSEISSMMTPDTPHNPVCFSSEGLFSSLI